MKFWSSLDPANEHFQNFLASSDSFSESCTMIRKHAGKKFYFGINI